MSKTAIQKEHHGLVLLLAAAAVWILHKLTALFYKTLAVPKDVRSRSNIRVAAIIFITCLIFYMLFFSGHHYSLDGMVMFQYGKSLCFDHSFKMSPSVKWGAFEFVVPQWAPGLSLAYTPLLAVVSRTIFRGDPSVRQIPSPSQANYEYSL